MGGVPALVMEHPQLPVKSPLFNLREICKQCALLEDHLNCEGKRCNDCITKHFLTIEALFEEAVGLDVNRKWEALTKGKADAIRRLSALWLDGCNPLAVAQGLRTVRKELTPKCFDYRVASAVANRFEHLGVHVCHRAAGNPVRALRTFLAGLYQMIEHGQDIDIPENYKVLPPLLRAVDEALTGKKVQGRPPYDDYARKLLGLDTVVMHLADGGYSRLSVSALEPPHLWLDEGVSLDTVIRNWKMLRG